MILAEGNFLTKLVCENTDCLSFIITLFDILTVLYLAYCASFRVTKGVRIFGWTWTAIVIAGTITVVAIHTCMFTIVSALFTALVLMALFGVTFEAISKEKEEKEKTIEPQSEPKAEEPKQMFPFVCPMATWQCAMAKQEPEKACAPAKEPEAVKEPEEVKTTEEVVADEVIAEEPKEEEKVETVEEQDEVDEKENEEADSENDEEETIMVSDEEGNLFIIRFNKSFVAKLKQSSDIAKNYYGELRNEILSYKKTRSNVSWSYDSVHFGRLPIVKFGVRGKTLCVYYPLNAEDYEESKYKVEKVEAKKYETTPCMYRIKNDRRLRYAKELFATIAEKFGMEKGEEHVETYDFPYETTDALIESKLIKKVRTPASAAQIMRAKK